MAQKLSVQDRKDLDKFTKFLALKATQIIVQSRLGEKVSTPCKPNTGGTDWVCFIIESFVEQHAIICHTFHTYQLCLQFAVFKTHVLFDVWHMSPLTLLCHVGFLGYPIFHNDMVY